MANGRQGGIPIINARDPLAGLRQALTGFVGSTLQGAQNQQLSQQLSQLFPQQNFQGVTNPVALQAGVKQALQQQQQQGALGLQAAKPITSREQIDAIKLRAIQNFTPEQLNELVLKAGTTTVNIGDTGKAIGSEELRKLMQTIGEANRTLPDVDVTTTVDNRGKITATIKKRPAASSEERTALTALRELQRKAAFVRKTWVKGDTGFLGGPAKRLLGRTGLVPLRPQGIAVRKNVEDFFKIVYGESGKALNEGELERLGNRLPTINIGDQEFDVRLDQFILELDALIGDREAGIKSSGLIVPRGAQGQLAPQRQPTNIPPPPNDSLAPVNEFRADFSAWRRVTKPSVWRGLPQSTRNKIRQALIMQIRWVDIVNADDIKAALEKAK